VARGFQGTGPWGSGDCGVAETLRDGENMVARASPQLEKSMTERVPLPRDQLIMAARKLNLPSRGDNSVAPDEGAALIRAFMRVEQREVRDAITEFVTRLSNALAKGSE
jgi:hypothetical protein